MGNVTDYHHVRGGGVEIRPDNQIGQLAALLAVCQTGARVEDADGRRLTRVVHRGSAGVNASVVLHFEEVK